MTLTRNEIMPGVFLTCVTTDKFKTGCLSISLLSQLCRETAAMNALVPHVLRRGTRRFPDMEQLSGELDRLYGVGIAPTVRKVGEIQAVGLLADFVDGPYVPDCDNLFHDVVRLTCEVLLDPYTEQGLLAQPYVESEKRRQLDHLRSRVNDKRSYSLQRIIELMCCYEDFSVSRCGDEETTEAVNARDLTVQYHKLLETCPIEIFYCGSYPCERVEALLLEQLKPLPRGEIDFDMGTDIRMNAVEEPPRVFTEELAVNQGKLSIGFRLGEVMEDPDYAAIYVMNALYGGCVTSKLFMNVREKLSLCYYASSMVDVTKGLLLVYSGIDFDKYDPALKEIFAQLISVKNGEFTDDELLFAKRSVSDALRGYQDSQTDLEHYWLGRNLRGDDCGPVEFSERVERVTREDVVHAASTLVCDGIYFLKGSGGTEEDEA